MLTSLLQTIFTEWRAPVKLPKQQQLKLKLQMFVTQGRRRRLLSLSAFSRQVLL